MLICHCRQVSDRQVRAAVRGGARTRREVARSCGAGGMCGGCAPAVEEILATESHPEPIRPLPGLSFSPAAG